MATVAEVNAPAAAAPSRSLRRVPMLLLLAIVVLAPVGLLHLINREMPASKADLVPVWVGTRAALQGQNPYSDATTRQIQIAYYGRPLRPTDHANKMAFAYPAHTLVVFAPLAPFSWPVARLVSLVLLTVLTAASVPLWLGAAGIRPPPARFLLILALTLASWPVIWGIHQIQPTLLVGALAAAGCFLLRRGYGVSAGVLFAIATIKPQLVGPLITWLCLWTLLRRQWSFLISFAVALAALLACGTWLVPGWIGDWRASMADYAVYRHLIPDFEFLLGRWAGLAISAVVGCAVLVALWRGRRCTSDSPAFGAMCALALSVAVCLLPNQKGMIYNHVLLLSAVFIAIFTEPAGSLVSGLRRLIFLQLFLNFLAVPLAFGASIVTGAVGLWSNLAFLDFLLPVLLTAFLTLNTLMPARPAAVPQLELTPKPVSI